MFKYLVSTLLISTIMIGCGSDSIIQGRTEDRVSSVERSRNLLQSVAAAPAANNPIAHDADPDIFFINGVVDYVSTNGDAIAMSIDIDRLFSDFEDSLDIFVTSFGNPDLLKGVQEGKRYTFKIKPRGVDDKVSRRRGIIWDYNIWCDLIQVMR